jgi:Cytochrome c7 and related cytochrome c
VENNPTHRVALIEWIALLASAGLILGCAQQPNVAVYSSRAADPHMAKRWSSPTFTTAHASFGDAAKHVNEIGIECSECHMGVQRSVRAGLPSIDLCMTCHESIGDASDERIRTLRDYAKRREEIPWQRVYGFIEESHVRFNHAPHIRAGVGCVMCHGDLTGMTVAERVVDHTMGFCINCHKQKGASNDCLTCHY